MQPPKVFTPPPKPEVTTYEEYMIVSTAAARAGLHARQRQDIEIDKRALPEKWCRMQPDLRVIRRELEAGREIPGAKLAGWSYVLEPIRKESNGESE